MVEFLVLVRIVAPRIARRMEMADVRDVVPKRADHVAFHALHVSASAVPAASGHLDAGDRTRKCSDVCPILKVRLPLPLSLCSLLKAHVIAECLE